MDKQNCSSTFFFVMAYFIGRNIDDPEAVFTYYSIVFVVALSIFSFYKKITDFSLKRNIKKLKKTGRLHYDSEVTYEFLDDSFIETTRDSESVIKYSIIEKVSSGTNAFYLFTSVQSAVDSDYRDIAV